MKKGKRKLKKRSKYRFRISGSEYNVIIEASNWIQAWKTFKKMRNE